MPIRNSSPQAYAEQWASGVTQTTAAGATTYGPFYPGPYQRVRIVIERTANTGVNQVLDAKVQYLDGTGDQVDLLDHAGNAISFVQWAAASNINKMIEIGPGVLSSDADDVLLYNTNFRTYNQTLPSAIYIVMTGTVGTDDTFSAYNDWLP